jgi:putative endopeptidase
MGDGTKEQAQEKLRNTKLKIGYPEKWEDYAGLDLQNDSLFANIRRGVSFRIARGIADMKKPVDHAEWSALPVMVDAYYEWSNNAIIFPAAILQPPFFDMAADDAYNYGAIGAVIGHELSHGFDDEGRQFDKDGNMRDWWEAEDSERFNARTRVLVDCFNAIELAPGLYANGELTLGENIADNGGLHTAFAAFQARRQALKGGFSPEQRFFIAYAILWRDKMNDEALANFTLTNKHAMGKWRVNAALPHIDEWYTAFGIQEGDPLYIAPEKRASIW